MVVPARIHNPGVARDLRAEGSRECEYVIRSGMDDMRNPRPQQPEKKKTVRKIRR